MPAAAAAAAGNAAVPGLGGEKKAGTSCEGPGGAQPRPELLLAVLALLPPDTALLLAAPAPPGAGASSAKTSGAVERMRVSMASRRCRRRELSAGAASPGNAARRSPVKRAPTSASVLARGRDDAGGALLRWARALEGGAPAPAAPPAAAVEAAVEPTDDGSGEGCASPVPPRGVLTAEAEPSESEPPSATGSLTGARAGAGARAPTGAP